MRVNALGIVLKDVVVQRTATPPVPTDAPRVLYLTDFENRVVNACAVLFVSVSCALSITYVITIVG